MPADGPRRGCIVTFYSYKGGTGRTMALANVASLLASRGERVLVVDWDLEAPGLHRFFPPRMRVAASWAGLGLDDTPGVVDLFTTLRDRIPASPPASEDEADMAVERAYEGLDLEDYVRDTAVSGVRIMRAGHNHDGAYSRRVGTFDWEALFTRAPGVYREFADRLTALYSWVLVDSRTGVTDISGICTSLLPERLVVVFTPNRQSLTGVHELVTRAIDYRRQSDDLRPLLVYPLPSRIEASREDLRKRWRMGDPDRDVIGYQPMFQDLLAKSYGLERCDLQEYFDEVQIQQTPDYAYGEEIAVSTIGGDRFSIANSYLVFTEKLKTGEPPWPQAEPGERPGKLPTSDNAPAVEPPAPSSRPPAAVTPGPVPLHPRQPPQTPRPPTAPPGMRPAPSATGPNVYLSYARPDRDRAWAITSALEGRNLQLFFDKDIEPGSDYSSAVSRQLDASDAVVVFWSRESIESAWVKAEAEEGLRRGILVPVLLDDVSPPLGFRSVQVADLRRPTSEALNRLAEAVERIATARPGTVVSSEAARPPSRRLAIPFAVAASVVALVAAVLAYVMSSPSAPLVTVPDFVGSPTADVSKTVELIGLTALMSDEGGTQAPYLEGVVTSQTPAAGASVARASRIELRVATRTVQVPTLVGTALNSALSALEAAGLRLGKTESQAVADARPGSIIEQTPKAGTRAAAGAAVDVIVATDGRVLPERLTLTADALDVSRRSGANQANLEVVLVGPRGTITPNTAVRFSAVNDASGDRFGRFEKETRNTSDGGETVRIRFAPGTRAPLGPATISVLVPGTSLTAQAKINVVN